MDVETIAYTPRRFAQFVLLKHIARPWTLEKATGCCSVFTTPITGSFPHLCRWGSLTAQDFEKKVDEVCILHGLREEESPQQVRVRQRPLTTTFSRSWRQSTPRLPFAEMKRGSSSVSLLSPPQGGRAGGFAPVCSASESGARCDRADSVEVLSCTAPDEGREEGSGGGGASGSVFDMDAASDSGSDSVKNYPGKCSRSAARTAKLARAKSPPALKASSRRKMPKEALRKVRAKNAAKARAAKTSNKVVAKTSNKVVAKTSNKGAGKTSKEGEESLEDFVAANASVGKACNIQFIVNQRKQMVTLLEDGDMNIKFCSKMGFDKAYRAAAFVQLNDVLLEKPETATVSMEDCKNLPPVIGQTIAEETLRGQFRIGQKGLVIVSRTDPEDVKLYTSTVADHNKYMNDESVKKRFKTKFRKGKFWKPMLIERHRRYRAQLDEKCPTGALTFAAYCKSISERGLQKVVEEYEKGASVEESDSEDPESDGGDGDEEEDGEDEEEEEDEDEEDEGSGIKRTRQPGENNQQHNKRARSFFRKGDGSPGDDQRGVAATRAGAGAGPIHGKGKGKGKASGAGSASSEEEEEEEGGGSGTAPETERSVEGGDGGAGQEDDGEGNISDGSTEREPNEEGEAEVEAARATDTAAHEEASKTDAHGETPAAKESQIAKERSQKAKEVKAAELREQARLLQKEATQLGVDLEEKR